MSIYTVHEPPLKAVRIHARSGALRVRARRLLVLGVPAGAVVDAAASAVAGVRRLRHRGRGAPGRTAADRRLAGGDHHRQLPAGVAGRFRGRDVASVHAGAARAGTTSAWSSATISKSAERRFFDAWVDKSLDGSVRGQRIRCRRRIAQVVRHRDGTPAADSSEVLGLFPATGSVTVSVAIVDYGSGNLHSAAKAFERAAREEAVATSRSW